jgi:hypothetical protein
MYCEIGFVYDSKSDSCLICDENCAVCEVHAECLKCRKGFVLSNNTCINISENVYGSSPSFRKLAVTNSSLNTTDITTPGSTSKSWIAGVVVGGVLLLFALAFIKFKWYHICCKPKPYKVPAAQPQNMMMMTGPSTRLQPIEYVPNQAKPTYMVMNPAPVPIEAYSVAPSMPQMFHQISERNYSVMSQLPPNLPLAPSVSEQYNGGPSVMNGIMPPTSIELNMMANNNTGTVGGTTVGGDDESKLCVICQSNPKNTVFSPCGHISCCLDCATSLVEKTPECPMCRVQIEDVIKVYI